MAELNEGKFSHIVDNDCVKKPGRELCCLSTRTAIKRGEGREDSYPKGRGRFKFWAERRGAYSKWRLFGGRFQFEDLRYKSWDSM